MSNEELNKKMEFIVEHQAKFAAEMEMMREVQAADKKLLSDALLGLVDIVGGLTRAQMTTEERVNLLADDLSRLAQAQAETAESLKILLNTVERHIHGNGGPANQS
jgi:hypothetical protein